MQCYRHFKKSSQNRVITLTPCSLWEYFPNWGSALLFLIACSHVSFAVLLRIIFCRPFHRCQCPRRWAVLRPRLLVAYWACGWSCWSMSRSRRTASRVSLGWPEPWNCWQTWRSTGATHCSPFTTSASALPTSHMSLPTVGKGHSGWIS